MNDVKSRLILLDLIRFVAAMAVVIFHYKSLYIESLPSDSNLIPPIYSITKFGYLGVDLFFLISGFVIFSSALNRTPSQFVISRATRIYPTLWVCLSITSLSIILLPSTVNDITVYDFLSNLTLLQSYMGYNHIDGVYWTLVVELKFYLCIFFLALTGWLNSYRIWLTIWLFATSMFAFFNQPFFMGWFISPEYSPYFISGIVFYLAQKEGYDKLYTFILGGAYFLALKNAYSLVDSFSQDVTSFDRYIVIAVVSCFYFVFYLMTKNKISIKFRKIYLVLGGMTYPLYLLHNIFGKNVYSYFISTFHPLTLLVLIVLVTMGISYIINNWLEQRLANRLKYFLIDQWENSTKIFKPPSSK